MQDADAEDAYFEIPRFQVGQLITIDQEYMRIIQVDTVNNLLYVQRAIAGTENVAHLRWSHILVYHPARDVRDLTMRWAAWLYKQGNPVPAEFHEALLAVAA